MGLLRGLNAEESEGEKFEKLGDVRGLFAWERGESGFGLTAPDEGGCADRINGEGLNGGMTGGGGGKIGQIGKVKLTGDSWKREWMMSTGEYWRTRLRDLRMVLLL